jgi:DNA-binding NtrC family response regulator
MYLTKEKFNIHDLVNLSVKPHRILVISPDEALRQIYQRHLEADQFVVRSSHFEDWLKIAEDLITFDLLILDIVNERLTEQQKWLSELRGNYPSVKIITVGMGLSETDLTTLMSAGIVGHIDKKLTRPQDLVLLIKTFINPKQLLTVD